VELVASETRWDELAASVAEAMDVETTAVHDAVRTPAGLDIGAETPEEIGLSILAELVAVRRGAGDTTGAVRGVSSGDADSGGMDDTGPDSEADRDTDVDEDAGTPTRGDGETAVDPVCGMTVDVDDAAATVTLAGERYHFCGTGCAEAFEADPERYLDEGVPTSG
jgi:xanthine dehydrogenase accessory factor